MKLKIISFVALTTLAAVVSGCVTSLDGRQQAGIPFLKDKKEALYARSPMEIWNVAKEVINHNGKLYSEDVMKSTLEGAVNTRTVWVKVEPVDAATTRLIVQARTKGGGSDVDLASDIDKQIALRLQAGAGVPSGVGAPGAFGNSQRRGT